MAEDNTYQTGSVSGDTRYKTPEEIKQRIAAIRANRGLQPDAPADQEWVNRILAGTASIGDARTAITGEARTLENTSSSSESTSAADVENVPNFAARSHYDNPGRTSPTAQMVMDAVLTPEQRAAAWQKAREKYLDFDNKPLGTQQSLAFGVARGLYGLIQHNSGTWSNPHKGGSGFDDATYFMRNEHGTYATKGDDFVPPERAGVGAGMENIRAPYESTRGGIIESYGGVPPDNVDLNEATWNASQALPSYTPDGDFAQPSQAASSEPTSTNSPSSQNSDWRPAAGADGLYTRVDPETRSVYYKSDVTPDGRVHVLDIKGGSYTVPVNFGKNLEFGNAAEPQEIIQSYINGTMNHSRRSVLGAPPFRDDEVISVSPEEADKYSDISRWSPWLGEYIPPRSYFEKAAEADKSLPSGTNGRTIISRTPDTVFYSDGTSEPLTEEHYQQGSTRAQKNLEAFDRFVAETGRGPNAAVPFSATEFAASFGGQSTESLNESATTYNPDAQVSEQTGEVSGDADFQSPLQIRTRISQIRRNRGLSPDPASDQEWVDRIVSGKASIGDARTAITQKASQHAAGIEAGNQTSNNAASAAPQPSASGEFDASNYNPVGGQRLPAPDMNRGGSFQRGMRPKDIAFIESELMRRAEEKGPHSSEAAYFDPTLANEAWGSYSGPIDKYRAALLTRTASGLVGDANVHPGSGIFEGDLQELVDNGSVPYRPYGRTTASEREENARKQLELGAEVHARLGNVNFLSPSTNNSSASEANPSSATTYNPEARISSQTGEVSGDAGFQTPNQIRARVAQIRENRGLSPDPESDQIWVDRITSGSHTIGDARTAITEKANEKANNQSTATTSPAVATGGQSSASEASASSAPEEASSTQQSGSVSASGDPDASTHEARGLASSGTHPGSNGPRIASPDVYDSITQGDSLNNYVYHDPRIGASVIPEPGGPSIGTLDDRLDPNWESPYMKRLGVTPYGTYVDEDGVKRMYGVTGANRKNEELGVSTRFDPDTKKAISHETPSAMYSSSSDPTNHPYATTSRGLTIAPDSHHSSSRSYMTVQQALDAELSYEQRKAAFDEAARRYHGDFTSQSGSAQRAQALSVAREMYPDVKVAGIPYDYETHGVAAFTKTDDNQTATATYNPEAQTSDQTGSTGADSQFETPLQIRTRVADIRRNRGLAPDPASDQIWVDRITSGSHTIGDARTAITQKAETEAQKAASSTTDSTRSTPVASTAPSQTTEPTTRRVVSTQTGSVGGDSQFTSAAQVRSRVAQIRANRGLPPDPASDQIWADRVTSGSSTIGDARNAITQKARNEGLITSAQHSNDTEYVAFNAPTMGGRIGGTQADAGSVPVGPVTPTKSDSGGMFPIA